MKRSCAPGRAAGAAVGDPVGSGSWVGLWLGVSLADGLADGVAEPEGDGDGDGAGVGALPPSSCPRSTVPGLSIVAGPTAPSYQTGAEVPSVAGSRKCTAPSATGVDRGGT